MTDLRELVAEELSLPVDPRAAAVGGAIAATAFTGESGEPAIMRERCPPVLIPVTPTRFVSMP